MILSCKKESSRIIQNAEEEFPGGKLGTVADNETLNAFSYPLPGIDNDRELTSF